MVLLQEILENVTTGLLSTTAQAAQAATSTATNYEKSKTESQIVRSTGGDVKEEANPKLEEQTHFTKTAESKGQSEFKITSQSKEKSQSMETSESTHQSRPTTTSISMHQSQPTTTFTCFSKLPAELRAMIWKYTFPEARFIPVRAGKRPLQGGEQEFRWTLHWLRPVKPVALEVCKESRTEALRNFKLMSSRATDVTDTVWSDYPTLHPQQDSTWASRSRWLPRAPGALSQNFYFSPSNDVVDFTRIPFSLLSILALMHTKMTSKDISWIKSIRIRRVGTKSNIIESLLRLTHLEKVALEALVFKNMPNLNKALHKSEQDMENFAKDLNKAFRKQRAGNSAFDGVGDIIVTSTHRHR